MNRFLVKATLFIFIVWVIDAALDPFFQYLVSHAKGGDTKRIEYICRHTSEDLLIFGSSRAIHHYDPFLLEDSLNLSCHNCGKNGNGIILFYGWYKMIQKRYSPSYILYEVTPSFDLLPSDNMTYLPGLRYWYDYQGIDSIFWKVDSNERYKMQLNSYQYNSQFLQLIMDNIKPLQQDAKGYRPLQGEMPYDPSVTSDNKKEYVYDSLKLYYLERLVQDCQLSGTQLIFAASPLYKNMDGTHVFAPIKNLCMRYGLPFINHYNDTTFNKEKSYFKDRAHMNQKGAEAYTQTIIKELKQYLKQSL